MIQGKHRPLSPEALRLAATIMDLSDTILKQFLPDLDLGTEVQDDFREWARQMELLGVS